MCYDLPLPCEVALERVRAAGLETQVAVKAGDLFEDSLRAVVGDDFNLALLFNVLHNLSEEQNRRALAEISRVMRPGGKLAVLEWLCQGAVPVSTGAAFMLQALFTTPGNAFRLNDVSSWLDAAGFKDVRGHAVASIPGTTLLIATRI